MVVRSHNVLRPAATLALLAWLQAAAGPYASADAAAPAAEEAQADADAARTDEQKHRARSVITLTMLVTGIALAGLLLLIIAVAARGISRRVARDQQDEKGRTPRVRESSLPEGPDQAADDAPVGEGDASDRQDTL